MNIIAGKLKINVIDHHNDKFIVIIIIKIMS